MKPTFSKLGIKINTNVNTAIVNGQEIEVKQYLPVQQKLELIGNAINNAMDENNFNNIIKFKVFFLLEVVFNYTNLSFTDKQKEDLVKLYDILESNGIFNVIINAMDPEEYKHLYDNAIACANNFYQYKNSILGIIDAMNVDYTKLNLDATEIQAKLADENNLAFLKNVLTKLG